MFAGMKQVGAVNVINATVMYIRLIIATVYVFSKLPGGNFDFIEKALPSSEGGAGFMLSIFGNADLMITFAVGCSTGCDSVHFCHDISYNSNYLDTRYLQGIYINPDADEKKLANITRIMIIILALAALAVSVALPTILNAINWVFAWIVPVLWIIVFGLFWKRNSKGTISWVLNVLWALTPLPASIGGLTNLYVTLIVSPVILIIGNLACKGEAGYLRLWGSDQKIKGGREMFAQLFISTLVAILVCCAVGQVVSSIAGKASKNK